MGQHFHWQGLACEASLRWAQPSPSLWRLGCPKHSQGQQTQSPGPAARTGQGCHWQSCHMGGIAETLNPAGLNPCYRGVFRTLKRLRAKEALKWARIFPNEGSWIGVPMPKK